MRYYIGSLPTPVDRGAHCDLPDEREVSIYSSQLGTWREIVPRRPLTTHPCATHASTYSGKGSPYHDLRGDDSMTSLGSPQRTGEHLGDRHEGNGSIDPMDP